MSLQIIVHENPKFQLIQKMKKKNRKIIKTVQKIWTMWKTCGLVQLSLDSESSLANKVSFCFGCVNGKHSEFDSLIGQFGAEAEICQDRALNSFLC